MTPAQPIFHALGLLVETVEKEEEVLWSHRCSAPVEAPGHQRAVEGGSKCVGKCVKRASVVGRDDKSAFG